MNPQRLCYIPIFYLTLMGISPIDYDVTLMFYFGILGLGPHCIWTWWFAWYIGRKPVTYVLCMILCVGRGPRSTLLLRCFVWLWNRNLLFTTVKNQFRFWKNYITVIILPLRMSLWNWYQLGSQWTNMLLPRRNLQELIIYSADIMVVTMLKCFHT